MKFIDEAKIKVIAGNGGHGCLSFRREKYIPEGGPDGGDGGDGGSIYLRATPAINTLVDFRYNPRHKAESGECGAGKNKRGKSGRDLFIDVPLGTLVFDADTRECIGDLVKPEQTLLVAEGGYHGLGNTRFKSSVNRTPRQTTQGSKGEQRNLFLELKLLADVGLLGLPNAGKSTLITAISNATPKVADYPFTTLKPNLGVVRLEQANSFVVADIPGLIEGAADGAGLGIQFLKHISRTKLLLHLVDIAPIDGSDFIENTKKIIHELAKFDEALLKKDRWLVINKIDLLEEAEYKKREQALIDALNWTGKVFTISAYCRQNLDKLCYSVGQALFALSD